MVVGTRQIGALPHTSLSSGSSSAWLIPESKGYLQHQSTKIPAFTTAEGALKRREN